MVAAPLFQREITFIKYLEQKMKNPAFVSTGLIVVIMNATFAAGDIMLIFINEKLNLLINVQESLAWSCL